MVRGMKTFGENVTRLPKAARRISRASVARTSSDNSARAAMDGSSASVGGGDAPLGPSTRVPAPIGDTLSGQVERASGLRVDEPADLGSVHAPGGKVLAGKDAGQGVVLFRPGDGEDDQPGAGDAGEGEGDSVVRVVAERIGVGHYIAARVIDVEGVGLGEERRGVAVGTEAEVDEAEVGQRRDLALVRVGGVGRGTRA